jgi:hypothetical protein
VKVLDPNDKVYQAKTLLRNEESEFILAKRYRDPYKVINNKTHKIEINSHYPYKSTSMEEVFEFRN